MSSRDRDFDPMELLHQASTEDAVPEETRARVRTAVTRAVQASVGASAAAVSHVAAVDDASDVQDAASTAAALLVRTGGAARPWLSKFLHWSAPALIIGAAVGATARDVLVPAGSRVHAVLGTSDPKVLPSLAPAGSIAAGVPPAAVTANLEVPAIVPPAGDSSGTAKIGNRARELAQERALLDQARARIAAGEPARALDFVERHERRFSQGALSEEREALAINALVGMGRYREAAQRGAAFRARYPNSLLMPSVEAAIAAIPER